RLDPSGSRVCSRITSLTPRLLIICLDSYHANDLLLSLCLRVSVSPWSVLPLMSQITNYRLLPVIVLLSVVVKIGLKDNLSTQTNAPGLHDYKVSPSI